MRTTDPVREIGYQDMIFSQWSARIRRTIANFFTEKARRLPASSDAESKTALTITEQINLLEQLERMDRGP
jgi:hypothetical protein